MRKIIVLLCILSLFQTSKGQIGTLDPSFGSGGFILTPANVISSFGLSTAKQAFANADGTISMVLQENDKALITRRLSNGDVDASYHNDGYSDVVSLYLGNGAIQSDGKIVVAGSPNQATGFMVARFNTDGTLDPSFGQNGVTITNLGPDAGYPNGIVIDPDGKIVLGGNSKVNGHDEFTVVRYLATGAVDATFGTNGIVTTDFNSSTAYIYSLALQLDGKILAGGTIQTNGNSDFALARYNSDGSPDLTFNSTGKVTSDYSFFDNLNSVVVASDGKFYAGGFSFDNSGAHFRITRYNSDGSVDLNFNSGEGSVFAVFGASSDILANLEIQNDGKILAAGYTNINPISTDFELIRINTDGSIDDNFGNSGTGLVVGDINSGQDEDPFITIQQDGKILVGGGNVDFSKAVGALSYSCFRYNPDGSPDNGFGSGGHFIDFFPSTDFSYTSTFLQSDGKLLAFSGSNLANDNNLYLNRFDANGTADNTFGLNGRLNLNATGAYSFFQPNGNILMLNYSSNNGDIVLTRLKPDGTPDLTFGSAGTVTTDLGGNETGSLIAVQPDNKIVVAGTARDDNGSDFLVLRYNPDGSLDGSFGTSGYVKINIDNEDQPEAISIGPDGQIVLGGLGYVYPPDFSFFNFDILLLRFNSDGSIDQSFADNGKLLYARSTSVNFLASLQVSNDNKILFNDGIFVGNEGYTSSLHRLNVDGSIDASFGQNGKIACDLGAIVLQPDHKILLAGYRVNSQENLDFALTRFTEGGSVDPSFGTNGQTIVSFTGLDNRVAAPLLSGNSLVVSGIGTARSGASFGVIAKFKIDDIASAGSITCPGNQTVNTDNNLCTAIVNSIDPAVTPAGTTVNYSLAGATIGAGSGSVSGKVFNRGVTTVTYTLSNDATKSCSFTVTVQDKQLPAINNLSVSQTTLWPPDHRLKDVTVNYTTSDNCGIASTQISVSSNEPTQSSEGDDQSPDWQIVDNHHIRLRAERLDNGNGRVYTIKITTIDVSGNQNAATTTVKVPLSVGNQQPNLIVTASPNPSHGDFWVTINSNSMDEINVRLLNDKGTVLNTISNINTPGSLKIGDSFMPGIYFLEVTQSGITKTIKLIKQ